MEETVQRKEGDRKTNSSIHCAAAAVWIPPHSSSLKDIQQSVSSLSDASQIAAAPAECKHKLFS